MNTLTSRFFIGSAFAAVLAAVGLSASTANAQTVDRFHPRPVVVARPQPMAPVIVARPAPVVVVQQPARPALQVARFEHGRDLRAEARRIEAQRAQERARREAAEHARLEQIRLEQARLAAHAHHNHGR